LIVVSSIVAVWIVVIVVQVQAWASTNAVSARPGATPRSGALQDVTRALPVFVTGCYRVNAERA